MMNNFTEQDRIEQFKKTMKYCMPDRFPEGFIDTLKEKGFFTAPGFHSSPRGIFRGVIRSFTCRYQFAFIPYKTA